MSPFFLSILNAIDYPDISPYLFSIGGFQLRYYSVIYVGGFILAYFILFYLAKKGEFKFPKEKLETLILYQFAGVVLCARLFYAVFYNPSLYLSEPFRILMIWHGGLSFHGGLFGSILAAYLFSRRYKINPTHMLDMLALCAPIALGLGRIGNFINGELWGRRASPDLWWAMVFPKDPLHLPRHPSQLYEAFGEGLLLALFLWLFFKYLKPRMGVVSGLFLLGYGVVRFVIEFFRQPDEQLGLPFFKLFSMGQFLCFLMIALAITWIYLAYKTEFFLRFEPKEKADTTKTDESNDVVQK